MKVCCAAASKLAACNKTETTKKNYIQGNFYGFYGYLVVFS